jgi:hypothetical protein
MSLPIVSILANACSNILLGLNTVILPDALVPTGLIKERPFCEFKRYSCFN